MGLSILDYLDKFRSGGQLILLRYGLYSLGFAEGLLLPKLLPAATYTEYEYTKYLAYLSPFLLCGAPTGFMVQFYNGGKDYYDTLLMGTVSIIALATGIMMISGLRHQYIVAVVAVLIFTVLEVRSRVRKKWILALGFKPLLACLSVAIAYFGSATILTEHLFAINVFGISILCYIFLTWMSQVRSGDSVLWRPHLAIQTRWREAHSIMKSVSLVTIVSLLCLGYIFFERHLVKIYYPSALERYSIAFTFAQIFIAGITSVSYYTSVNYGERIGGITRESLTREMRLGAAGLASALMVYLAGVWVVSRVLYPNMENLTYTCILILIPKAVFYFVGIFSHLLVYSNKQRTLLAASLVSIVPALVALIWLTPMIHTIEALYGIHGSGLILYAILILGFLTLRMYPNLSQRNARGIAAQSR